LPMPLSFGNPDAPMQNVARVSNRGLEFTVEHRNKVGQGRYSVNGNISYNENKILNLNKQRVILSGGTGGLTILQEGSSINSWFGYKIDGLLTDEDIESEYPKFNPNNVAGSLKFMDLNENGVIDEADRTVIGDGATPYTFGLNT